ncbi:apolipoprotein N-acyltransferase [Trueperella sp. LYQ141]|uniref:apolipoprotein N-acyltransferase n=1 Tax=Trueperella sp. LYQ141 TaxID=3391058 RepID=UPI003983B47E
MRIVLAILAGCGLYAANTPLRWWALIVPALMFLWWAVRGQRVGRAACLGMLTGLCYFMPLFSWAAVAAQTPIALVALAGVESCYISLCAALWALSSRVAPNVPRPYRIAVRAGCAAAIWTAIEQLRCCWPLGGMPWGRLGFALVDSPMASLAPYGSTALIAFVCVMAAVIAVEGISRSYLASSCAVGLAGVFIVVPAIIPGGLRPVGATISVAIIQGGVPDDSTPDKARIVTENHIAQTRQLFSKLSTKPDLVLWPESSSDRDIRVDPELGPQVMNLVNDIGVPLVMGTQRYEPDGRYNDVLVIVPHRGPIAYYRKQHPVPFGEYVPLRTQIRSFAPAVDRISKDMLPGDGIAVLDVPLVNGTIRLAVPICFEIADEEIVARAVKAGAELIVVPTNNASFGKSELGNQQFDITRFRAREHGRTAIQVSTSGVSGASNSRSVTQYRTAPLSVDARVIQVARHTQLTPATQTYLQRWWVVWILGASASLGVSVAALLELRVQRKAKR